MISWSTTANPLAYTTAYSAVTSAVAGGANALRPTGGGGANSGQVSNPNGSPTFQRPVTGGGDPLQIGDGRMGILPVQAVGAGWHGVNQAVSPELLGHRELEYSKNFEGWSRPGSLRRRAGMVKNDTQPTPIVGGVSLLALHQEDTNGKAVMAACCWDSGDSELDFHIIPASCVVPPIPESYLEPAFTIERVGSDLRVTCAFSEALMGVEKIAVAYSRTFYPTRHWDNYDDGVIAVAQEDWRNNATSVFSYAGVISSGQSLYVSVWALSRHGVSRPQRMLLEYP